MNPTERLIVDNLTVPLWYAGLAPGARVRVFALADVDAAPSVTRDPIAPSTFTVGAGAGFTDVVLPVSLRPKTVAALAVEVV